MFSTTLQSEANSIIATVNDELVLFSDIRDNMQSNANKAQKLALLNQQIDLILQFEQIRKIGINPKELAINQALNTIATENNLSLSQLKTLPIFANIKANVHNQLALRGLQRFVLRDAKIKLTAAETKSIAKDKTAQLKLLQKKQADYFNNWVLNLRKNAHIEIFADKL